MDPSNVSNNELHSGTPLEQILLEYYDTYNDALFRFCFFQTGNREISIDIVQETFIKVWEIISEGNVLENPKAFLYRVARNKVIDYYRKKRSVSLDMILETGVDFGLDTESDAVTKDEAKRLYDLVEHLDEKSRQILTLRYGEDFSIEEISESLGISENNVSVRLHRALAKLEDLHNEQNDI